MKLTFLGTGTSTGVPVIACDCPVCTSGDQRNQRTRASLLVESDGYRVIIDTSPDLRQQVLRAGLRRLDAVLFTHSHADHVGGLDDLRGFNVAQRTRIPCYGDAETIHNLRTRFPYMFNGHLYFGAKPELTMHLAAGAFQLFGLEIVPLVVYHGWLPVLGYRIGANPLAPFPRPSPGQGPAREGGRSFAYLTDCNAIPAASMEALRGLDVLVLGALRHQPHPTHFTVEEALEVVGHLKPRRACFTHMAHDLDYQRDGGKLPRGVELAYDGLVIDLE